MIRLPRFALATALLAPLAPAVVVTTLPAAAYAQARDASAEQFVQSQANRALGILRGGAGRAAQKQQFRAFVDQVADVPRITTFVLGKYARSITPAQRTAFAQVFREYASNVYETRLGDYSGQTLRVTGSVVRRPGDVVVTSQITGGQTQAQTVSWRLVKDGRGAWRVVDVQVAGVWLAITQQQDFVSTIDNAGGNIDALIGQLRQQVQQQEATGRA